MDASAALDAPPSLTVTTKKKKKKSNRVAPGAEAGPLCDAAATDGHTSALWPKEQAPAVKTKKLKPLKKASKHAVVETDTASRQQTAGAAEGVPAGDGNDCAAESASDGTRVGGAVARGAPEVPPWWVPPCGSETVPGAETDHGITMVTDLEQGVQDAIETRTKNQPRVPVKDEYVGSQCAPGPFPLGTPVFSRTQPNLSDLGMGICLYFDTLRAYGFLFLGLFLLNSASIVITFLTNPSAGRDALEQGGILAAIRVVTIGAMFKGTLSNTKGCDAERCLIAPELGMDGTIFGTPAALPMNYVTMALAYLDLASAVVFLFFTAWYQRRIQRIAREVDRNTISLADYSVWVTNVPANISSETVKAHFDRYDGTVCPTGDAATALQHFMRLNPTGRVHPDPEMGVASLSCEKHDGLSPAVESVEHGGGGADQAAGSTGCAGQTTAENAMRDVDGGSGMQDASGKGETPKKKKKKKKKPTGEAQGTPEAPKTRKKELKKSRTKEVDGWGAAITPCAAENDHGERTSLVSAANFGALWHGSGQFTARAASASPTSDHSVCARRSPALCSAAERSPRFLGEEEGLDDVECGSSGGVCLGAASVVEVDGQEEAGELHKWSSARSLSSHAAGSDVESADEMAGAERVVWVAGADLGERDPSRDQGLASVGAEASMLHGSALKPMGDGEAPPREGESPKKRKKKKKDEDGGGSGGAEGSLGKKQKKKGKSVAQEEAGKSDGLAPVAADSNGGAADDSGAPGRARGYNALAAVASVMGGAEEVGPHGWKETWDALDGRKLYVHVASGTKQYVKPPELARFEEEEEERRREDAAAGKRGAACDSAGGADAGPFEGVASVFIMRRCSALLETLRQRAPVMEMHFLLRSHPDAERRSGPKLEMAGMQLRKSEEKVRGMCVEGGAMQGPAIRGRAQEAVGALVIFNSKYARTDCLRHYSGKTGVRIGVCFSSAFVLQMSRCLLHLLSTCARASCIT